MSWLARSLAIVGALAGSGCGRIGIDLLDLSAGLQDGGFVEPDAGSPGQVEPAADGGSRADAGGSTDSGATSDGGARDDAGPLVDAGSPADAGPGSPSDAGPRDGATDAQAFACSSGFANCDSNPMTCETQLGSVANCASCGNACLANGGTPVCNAGMCATVCSLTGTYAVKLAVTVNWPTGVVNAGSGTSTIWARFTGTQSGNDLVGTIEPCGFSVPDFSLNPLVGNELYQLSFPNTLFDHVPAYIPATAATLSSSSGFTLGRPFNLAQLGLQVGAGLSNPASDPWPPVATLSAPDMDADSKPGVTGSYSSAAGYTVPRANATGSSRADRAYAAARFALSASGTLNSCTDFGGTASFTSFDTHVVGCRIAGGADCSTAQRDVVDNGRPLFAPTGASLRLLKVAAGATCTAVRTALP